MGKSKWNFKEYSSNPQEGRKKKTGTPKKLVNKTKESDLSHIILIITLNCLHQLKDNG